uniref:Putative secreted mucin n=1 Tax=Amblyomma parvum TaxID=251391 RepID=A0A023G2L5_AMBPA
MPRASFSLAFFSWLASAIWWVSLTLATFLPPEMENGLTPRGFLTVSVSTGTNRELPPPPPVLVPCLGLVSGVETTRPSSSSSSSMGGKDSILVAQAAALVVRRTRPAERRLFVVVFGRVPSCASARLGHSVPSAGRQTPPPARDSAANSQPRFSRKKKIQKNKESTITRRNRLTHSCCRRRLREPPGRARNTGATPRQGDDDRDARLGPPSTPAPRAAT